MIMTSGVNKVSQGLNGEGFSFAFPLPALDPFSYPCELELMLNTSD
jgi:hypothetical protein